MNHEIPLPTVTYTPASQLRAPGLLWRAMWRDLRASRELAWRLFVRDVSAQYRQSVFGVLWAFAPPLVTGLIFIVLQASKAVDLGETEIPYPLFVLIGTLLWQTFADALNAPLKSVNKALPMLTKISFPREALILSALYTVLFGLLVKSLILAGIFVFFQVAVTPGLLLAPFAVLQLVLLGIAIGLLLTPFGVLYSDISAALPIMLQMLFFVTPVVYSPPDTFPFSLIALLNPIAPLLLGSRELIATGRIEDPLPFLIISGVTLIALVAGTVLYRLAMPIILERTSA